MSVSAGYSDFVVGLFEDLGCVRVKRMFGAAGVYLDDVMFALIDDDVVYLKSDDALVEKLKAFGSVAWAYVAKRDGLVRDMGYWQLPDIAADDSEIACALARQAFEIASRKKKRARTGKKKPA